MNRDRMRIWIDALRNEPPERQCVGELVDMRGCHCVIGVGIVASGKEPSYHVSQYEQITQFVEWLNCERYDALFVRHNGVRHSVMELNDRFHLTLREIADLLEAEHLAATP